MTEYEGAMVSPSYMPIIGYPQAWSGSTDGKVTGDAIMAPPITTMAEMDKLHGTLKGKIVLLGTGPLDLAFPDSSHGRALYRRRTGSADSGTDSHRRRRPRWRSRGSRRTRRCHRPGTLGRRAARR